MESFAKRNIHTCDFIRVINVEITPNYVKLIKHTMRCKSITTWIDILIRHEKQKISIIRLEMKFYNRYTSFSFLFFLIFNEKRRTKEKFFLRSLDYDRRISRRKMRFFHGISVIPFIGRLKFIRKQSYYNSENEIRSGNLWRREEGDMVVNEMALGLSRK